MPRLPLLCFLIFRLLFYPATGDFLAFSQSASSEINLTVEEIVKLTRAGFSEDIVVTKIKKNAKPFDLSTDELLDLKKDGVTDTVIKYMLDPSLPYTPAVVVPNSSGSPTKAAESAKKYPADPYASRVPPDPDLYFFPANTLAKIDLKFLLGIEEPKTLMKKGKTVAYLIGPAARTRIKSPTPVFYARLPEGKEIEELVLVSLTEKNGRRELELGAPGPKQELKAEDITAFDALEVGSRLYKLTPIKLAPGQYLFFFIGSAEPPKGVFGKGYDFGFSGSSSPAK